MKHCTNCGGELSDDAKFCTWCGTAVPVAAAAAAVTMNPVPAAAPTPTPASYTINVNSAGTYPSSAAGYSTQASGTQSYTTQTYAAPAQTSTPYTTYAQPTYPSAATPSTTGGKDGLGIAAIVFLGVSILMNLYNLINVAAYVSYDSTYAGAAVLYGILLAVSVVITVLAAKKIKSKEKISTAFKVVTLLFGSLVSGILLFVRKEELL